MMKQIHKKRWEKGCPKTLSFSVGTSRTSLKQTLPAFAPHRYLCPRLKVVVRCEDPLKRPKLLFPTNATLAEVGRFEDVSGGQALCWRWLSKHEFPPWAGETPVLSVASGTLASLCRRSLAKRNRDSSWLPFGASKDLTIFVSVTQDDWMDSTEPLNDPPSLASFSAVALRSEEVVPENKNDS